MLSRAMSCRRRRRVCPTPCAAPSPSTRMHQMCSQPRRFVRSITEQRGGDRGAHRQFEVCDRGRRTLGSARNGSLATTHFISVSPTLLLMPWPQTVMPAANTTEPGSEPYLPVEEVAKRLDLPLGILLRRVEAGDVPSRREESADGVHYLVRLGDLGIEAPATNGAASPAPRHRLPTRSTTKRRRSGPDCRCGWDRAAVVVA